MRAPGWRTGGDTHLAAEDESRTRSAGSTGHWKRRSKYTQHGDARWDWRQWTDRRSLCLNPDVCNHMLLEAKEGGERDERRIWRATGQPSGDSR